LRKKLGDEGLAGLIGDSSMDEDELEYLRWPRVENVGVTGEGRSEADELYM
jgi:hypothetical protein